MSALELFQDWQESLKHALAEKLGAERMEEELLGAVGLQVETGLLAGPRLPAISLFCAEM